MNSARLKKTEGFTRLLSLTGLHVGLISLLGCQPVETESSKQQGFQTFNAQQHMRVSMSLHYASKSLDCEDTFVHGEHEWQLERAALFSSDWQFLDSQTNTWHSIDLLQSGWQTQDVALLWFDQQCGSESELPKNQNIDLDIPAERWQQASQVRFTLAVPFANNHLNPLTQPSPLNMPEMFWSWQTGFKFIRFDMRTQSEQLGSVGWSYHLGSIGCESASSMRPPQRPCNRPNRIQITLEKQSASKQLVFDIAALLDGIKPTSMASCMFHRDNENSCGILWSNINSGSVIRWQSD